MSPRRTRPAVDPPETVDEALQRAGQHARSALAESLSAVRALLDAVSLALTGQPATEAPEAGEIRSTLAKLGRVLDGFVDSMGGDDSSSAFDQLGSEMRRALDVEIGRWEVRSQTDPDARAVLRAFIGLREALWELGLRPKGEAEPTREQAQPRREPRRRSPRGDSGKSRPRRRRVQRVDVEG